MLDEYKAFFTVKFLSFHPYLLRPKRNFTFVVSKEGRGQTYNDFYT